jgi:hypothetical protein
VICFEEKGNREIEKLIELQLREAFKRKNACGNICILLFLTKRDVTSATSLFFL